MAQNIPDGKTKNGKVEARPGVHGETSFVYRLCDSTAYFDYRRKLTSSRNGADELNAHANFIAQHLVTWDRAGDAPAVEPNAAAVRALHHLELNALVDHISGWTLPQDVNEMEKN